jgi:4-alpha-glucanotransferase
LLVTDPAVEYANARREREEWAALLREGNFLASETDLGTDSGLDAMTVALHRAVGSTQARLIGIGLTDLVGDRRAQNQPGTYLEYPNWRVPMTDAEGHPMVLEDLMTGTPLLGPIVESMRYSSTPRIGP